jgi:general secretion pathway protein L
MAASPDVHSQRPPSDGGRRLADFWRWWRGEISRMLPERFASMGGGAPLLYIEGEEAVAVDPHGASGSAEKRVSLAGLDEARRKAAVRTLLDSVGETRGRARAAVRHEEALMRRVTLPAATEENLPQVLAFEMDRLSPFQADEVYFDQRVVTRDAGNANIIVELAMARRDAVDARVRELRDLGVSVQGVALRDDARRAAAPFDLLPSEQRGERETARERFVRNSLIGAVLVLFAAALIYPIWKKRDAVVEMLPVVEKARQEAQATNAVVSDLERQAADYNYLLTRRHAWYPVAAYVEEISRLLPDTTWLQQLDIKTSGKAKEVVITGETASASKLIEILEQSKMLQNAAPRGPTTRGSTPGMERFMIGAELRPRAPPEAQPLAAPPAGAARPVAVPQGANAAVPQGANSVPPGANAVPPPATPPKSSGFGPFPRQ